MASVQDIYNEIDRIDGAKGEIAEAIEEKGVAVPEEAKIEEYPGLVRQIRQGSEHAVEYVPQELTPEQQGQARENIGAGTYTKPDGGIPESDLAQGVQQSLAKAESAYQKPTGGIPKTDLATAVQNSLGKADTALQPSALTPITDLIPEQATPQNQLADKNFVNSSVATNTANYISDNGQPFQSVADLEAYTGTLTNNDYAFVVGTDSAGNTTYTRYKYNATTGEWAEEYVLNNSSFTAEQWAAISSGITALLVQKLTDLPTEVVTYVTQTLTDAQKQQARANIGATAPEIFWATYGVTTAAQIDQAVADGKMVVCYADYSAASGHLFVLTQTKNTLYWEFGCTEQSVSYYLRCNKTTNVWSQQRVFLEQSANKSNDIPTDRESIVKYPSAKAVFDSLGKWGIISQTQTWTGSTATGYDYTMSNPVWGMIPQANIDLYEAAGAVFNESTGYFEIEDMHDISYMEMKDIYAATIGLFPYIRRDMGLVGNKPIRATLPLRGSFSFAQSMQYFAYQQPIEQVSFPNGVYASATAHTTGAFQGCIRLKRITGVFRLYSTTNDSAIFRGCSSLEDVKINYLRGSITLENSSRLTLASVVYMVQTAANTTAITITLHATAYARCQADTTEYTYNGNTYTGIIAYAAAKNITIASA